jgi:hypothetical protein
VGWGRKDGQDEEVYLAKLLSIISPTFFVKKSDIFFPKKMAPFLSKKPRSFFGSKMAEVQFFSVLESPAYISANRIGNFFYIEK